MKYITKRDGSKEPYNIGKIQAVIQKAFSRTSENSDENIQAVLTYFVNHFSKLDTVEEIQDAVEKSLMAKKFYNTAKEFILYRKQRENIRNSKTSLVKTFKEVLNADGSDISRENANVDGKAPMGLMLLFGSEIEKDYVKRYMISPRFTELHESGDFHIHDLNMYACTFNCCNIGLKNLLEKGFSTGHGTIRPPQSIQTAMTIAAIVIQANQNDMFGGQGLPLFDYEISPFVSKNFGINLKECIEILLGSEPDFNFRDYCFDLYHKNGSSMSPESLREIRETLKTFVQDKADKVIEIALKKTDNDVFQACEGFVHNLNTLNSRCGSQVPFSSINYGTCKTREGQMLIENILRATDNGLGNKETSIFPVQIFKIKEGVNANPGDPNYYLYEMACKVSAKRMYPNFVNIDVPGNIEYYQEGKPETEMATMGCRTKTLAMLDGTARVTNRGNIAFTTINLPRLGIISDHSVEKFFELLDQRITDCIDELLERVNYIKTKKVYNFPFLMGQNIYLGAENLGWNDTIEPALKNGTLAVGFIGIAEALKALTGKHHGESEESYELALKIVKTIRERTDKATKEYGWQFGCFATPAEGLSERFVKIDKKKFGVIEGVTDREFYTNSFHIPVYYPVTASEKMQKEGVFHELCNAGAITYVEMDGDPLQNLQAFKKIVDYSRKCGISYFSINHNVDRCPICGFQGIIESDVCPNCGWKEGSEISLEELEAKGIDTKKFR